MVKKKPEPSPDAELSAKTNIKTTYITVIGGVLVVILSNFLTYWLTNRNSSLPPIITYGDQGHDNTYNGPVNINNYIYSDTKTSKDEKTLPIDVPKKLTQIDSNYEEGLSSLESGDYKNAVNYFSEIYKLKPNYPKLALKYGDALSNSGKKEEAISVWLSMPKSEYANYWFMDFLIGSAQYDLRNYHEAKKYITKSTELDHLKTADCRYWATRALLKSMDSYDVPIQKFIDDTNNFVDSVDNDIRNLEKDGIRSRLDSAHQDDFVHPGQPASFWLLWCVSFELYKEKEYCDSLDFALRAVEHLPGPVSGGVFVIDTNKYADFLNYLASLLLSCESREIYKARIDISMKQIENHIRNKNEYAIGDFAFLLRAFYGEAVKMHSLIKGDFELIYQGTVADEGGLKLLKIESPDYLYGKNEILLGGEKQFTYKKTFTLCPSKPLNEKPYFKVSAKDLSGNISEQKVFPQIKLVKDT